MATGTLKTRLSAKLGTMRDKDADMYEERCFYLFFSESSPVYSKLKAENPRWC